MPTINQIIKKGGRKKGKKKRPKLALALAYNSRRRSFSLKNNPQRKGICKKVVKLTPKKPNSAMRSCVRVSLINSKKEVMAHVPGEGHNLQDYSTVLIQGGRAKDLPGVQYRVVRGCLDTSGVVNEPPRANSRSRYGVKMSKRK